MPKQILNKLKNTRRVYVIYMTELDTKVESPRRENIGDKPVNVDTVILGDSNGFWTWPNKTKAEGAMELLKSMCPYEIGRRFKVGSVRLQEVP